MTDDTSDNNNVKQFTLNLVTPSKDKDMELRECLDKGLEVFTEILKGDKIQSFFAIVLDESDQPILIGAGEQLTLKTLGALRMAENELLAGM